VVRRVSAPADRSEWVTRSLLTGCQCAIGGGTGARARLLLHYNTTMAVFALLPLVWLFGEVRPSAAQGTRRRFAVTNEPAVSFGLGRAGEYQFEFLSNEDVVYFLGEPQFWFVMTITAVAGFLINIAIFLQIKVTTPLTNTISGTAKVCGCRQSGSIGCAAANANASLSVRWPWHRVHRRASRRCWAGSSSATSSRSWCVRRRIPRRRLRWR